ncbi:MAG: VacB/RNase II family 3'-5' exoribonuclease [Planctomycetota bacterium]|nr:VacB/RNase II family 3'-5' exoribonuclease [Planctomycetota bacterium]
MPSKFTQRILDHISNPRYVPKSVGELEKHFRIPAEEDDEFRQALGALIQKDQLVLGHDDVVQLPPMPTEFTGTIKITSRGFGFVKSDVAYRGGDLYVPESGMMDAISGDRVRVMMTRGGGGRGGGSGNQRDRTRGRIVEILERNKTSFTGSVARQHGEWYVLPDGKRLRTPILARDGASKNVKEGDKVVIEIVHFPSEFERAEGVITRILGPSGRPDVETEAVITDYGLRTDFPEEVVEEAGRTARSFDGSIDDSTPDRMDLTDLLTFTIDPPDAKDFDDAISLEFDEATGEYELGVHIADVAHFVRPDGPLDREAFQRGNSTYLPRLVLPMLPELLSNGVCSLQEGVPRFVKSVFITYDEKGRIAGRRYHRSVIKSRKRLTYLEAQALIDGDQKKAIINSKAEPTYSEELIEALRHARRLAKIIRKRRFADGMLSLSLPESEIVFDDAGEVTDAMPEDDAYTHTIIEMFMVAANEAVASLFADLKVPLIRRIHPEPDYGDLGELRNYARLVRFKIKENPDRRDLQELSRISEGTPFERAIHFSLLKTMTRASYSPTLVGHFALASEQYAHFTSPIRRYPDLTVHRALDAYLDQTRNGTELSGGKGRARLRRAMDHDANCPDEDHLVQVGDHCSATEKNSEEAERSLREFLVLQFLKSQDPTSTYEGTVTGTTANGGVFITLDRFLVDGMIRPDDMPGRHGYGTQWRQDRLSGRLVAPKSGASIGIGDRAVVQVGLIDLHAREMDLVLVSFDAITEFKDPDAHRNTPWRKADPSGRGDRRGKPKKGKRKGYKMGRRGRRSL